MQMKELTPKQLWFAQQIITITTLDKNLTDKDIVTVMGCLINKYKVKRK